MLIGYLALQALEHPHLVPPPRPSQSGEGATAALRDAMARFSGPTEHAARRRSVLDLLGIIDLDEVTRTASALDRELSGDADSLRWSVPTYTLAAVLGVTADREQIRADTEAIAPVIGRNEPSSAESDESAERLLAACARHPDPVAAVSILYQNHDATAGLVQSEMRRSFSAATTRRVATTSMTIGDLERSAGNVPPVRCHDPGDGGAFVNSRPTPEGLDRSHRLLRLEVFSFCPPDFALRRCDTHQGSSAIIRADDSSAQATSVSSWGCSRYPRAILAPISSRRHRSMSRSRRHRSRLIYGAV